MGSLNWASGLIPHMRPLQRHFYSLGLTDRCASEPLVLATLLRQWQELSFLTPGILIRPFQVDFTIYPDASTQGWGAHPGDSQILSCSECKLHINVLEHKVVGNIGPPTLGHSITGPSCYDRYRQYHCCSLYQQTGEDPFPHPVAAGSGSVSMATVSRYSHLGQTHSGLPHCDSRLVISAEPAHHDRVEPPP